MANRKVAKRLLELECGHRVLDSGHPFKDDRVPCPECTEIQEAIDRSGHISSKGDRLTRLTIDPDDPRLTRGVDTEPRPQSEAYLVLSEEERAKGFVRPVRRSYIHIGLKPPEHPLRDLTEEQQERYGDCGYVKYEKYPEGDSIAGSYWTQERLNKVDGGCRVMTTMSRTIAETYAREPKFYGSTYCCGCRMHLPVAEFRWDGTDLEVGS